MATSLPSQPTPPATPPPLTPEQIAARKAQERQTRAVIISLSAIAVLVLALLITAIYILLAQKRRADLVGKIRDVFIIVVGIGNLDHRGCARDPADPVGQFDQPFAKRSPSHFAGHK